MNKKTSIVIVAHALVIPVFQKRWKRLAEDEQYEVHLLVPQHWEQNWFGETVVHKTEAVREKNFFIHPMPTTSVNNWSRYLFKSIDGRFREIKPDLIYIVHEESVWIHHQIYLYRFLFAPNAKIIFFSMNASGIPFQKQTNQLKRMILEWMWNNIKRNTEAALVHYPGCLKSLRGGGYKKPIFLQTQVGVDEISFSANASLRFEYRKKLRFEGQMVVGYVGRLIKDKGVDDIFEVFCSLANKFDNLALLLVGNGNLREEIERKACAQGLQERVKITGYVDQEEVPAFLNAMDIFVLASKTMPHWIDTFPLATVQAQAVKLPVVSSDSASLPWQLGGSARLFKEGDREELAQALIELLNNEDLRSEFAINGQKRSHTYFCHSGMTENFKKIVAQVMSEEFVFHKEDEEYIQWKAY